jgi:hypothetical protein
MEKKSRLVNILIVCLIVFGGLVIFSVGVILPEMRAKEVIREKTVMAEFKRVEDKKLEDKRIANKVIEDKRIADQIIEDKRIEAKIFADKKIEDEKARLIRVENKRIADKELADVKKLSEVNINKTIHIDGIEGYENDWCIKFTSKSEKPIKKLTFTLSMRDYEGRELPNQPGHGVVGRSYGTFYKGEEGMCIMDVGMMDGFVSLKLLRIDIDYEDGTSYSIRASNIRVISEL